MGIHERGGPEIESLLEQLSGNKTVPVILMSGSLYLAIAGIAVKHPLLEGLVASIAVGLAMIGSLLELRLLTVLQEIEDAARGRERGLLRKVAEVALRVALFYTIIGTLAVAGKVRSVLEGVRAKAHAAGEASVSCPERYYRPFLIVVTLGMYLAVFQQCALEELASRARSLLEEPPIDLGAEGYEGQ
ncbi:MAG: hypothetical protein F7C07_05845 [Desulfurococcales archaeon]|nr:hypothetical protein [Desulfurococcales archaeon]